MSRLQKKYFQSHLPSASDGAIEPIGAFDHSPCLVEMGRRGAQQKKRQKSGSSVSTRAEDSEAGPTRELILRLIDLFRA